MSDTNLIRKNINNFINQETLFNNNLNDLFKRIHNYIYSNSEMTKPDKIADELIKLIYCKIYIELNQIDISKIAGENQKAIGDYLRILFQKIKMENPEVFDINDEILLSDKSIFFAYKLLSKYELLNVNRDVLSEAFQSVISPNLRSGKGQFFTPKNVVQMCIDIISPKVTDKIIDPACGSGSFLIETFNKFKDPAILTNLYGIDKESDMAKITRSYISILGNGKSRIFNADSLALFKEKKKVKDVILDGFFDVVMTNPPFGTKIKIHDTDILKEYKLGHKYKKVNDKWVMLNKLEPKDPQILFIEKGLNLLKDDGKMAIVLPDGVLSNPSYGYVVDFIIKNFEIIAVVSLPPEAFLPSTHTKTSVIFLKKKIYEDNKDYKIFMSIIENIGHDKNGKPLYKLNNDGSYMTNNFGRPILNDESLLTVQKFKDFMNNKLIEENRLGFSINIKNVENRILIPTYYNPEAKSDLKNNDITLTKIGDLVKKGILSIERGHEVGSKYYGKGPVPFVRTTDLANFEIIKNPYKSVPYEIYLKYKDKQDIQINDILLVTDGTFLIGTTAIVTEKIDMIIQSHIRKIRCNEPNILHPYLLLYLLNTKFVQDQIKSKVLVQSTISTIGNRLYDIQLPIPNNSEKVNYIISTMSKIIAKKREIKILYDELINGGGV